MTQPLIPLKLADNEPLKGDKTMDYRIKNALLFIVAVGLYILSTGSLVAMCYALLGKLETLAVVLAVVSSAAMITATALMLLYVLRITNRRIRQGEQWYEPIR